MLTVECFVFSTFAIKCDLICRINVNRLLFGRAFKSWEPRLWWIFFYSKRKEDWIKDNKHNRGKERAERNKKKALLESVQRKRFVIVVSPECQFDRQYWALRCSRVELDKYTMNWSNYCANVSFNAIFMYNGIPLVMTCLKFETKRKKKLNLTHLTVRFRCAIQ